MERKNKEIYINYQIPTENKEIPFNKVVLGDQSPWAGGLLRYKVLKAVANDVEYNFQDADSPWRQDGISYIKLKRGWVDYWSLANRHPLSFSTPTARMDSIRQSMGSPDGLSYIAGPKTHKTLKSEINNTKLVDLTKEMLMEEATWATKVADWIGNSNGVYKGQQIQEVIKGNSTSIKDILTFVANCDGLSADEILNFSDKFKFNTSNLTDYLPKNYYWNIDSGGNRHEFVNTNNKSESRNILPKGRALPLEICARGDTLAFTGLSYLDQVIDLRDRYIPSLKLKLLQIHFNWEINPDPIETMWNIFEKKKKGRSQSIDKPINELQDIKDYWSQRPTSVSYSILGGNLNPIITFIEK